MIVMIADQQILSAQQVCQNCVMSDQSGLPRWHDSKLRCGKMRSQSVPRGKSRSPKGFALTLTLKGTPSDQDSLHISPRGVSVEAESSPRSKQAQVYECQMGFNVTWIN